ncbi:MAG: hypothetical protein ACPIOQ_15870, partial [Promethearchaeia archaeon]
KARESLQEYLELDLYGARDLGEDEPVEIEGIKSHTHTHTSKRTTKELWTDIRFGLMFANSHHPGGNCGHVVELSDHQTRPRKSMSRARDMPAEINIRAFEGCTQ